ncbi:MAG TPA: DUF2911 domain-containing protein [Gemmatimonadaceae bacterium]|nr:DUF2911 domain-containing protein [Gemmatimonadaceae bacterium]
MLAARPAPLARTAAVPFALALLTLLPLLVASAPAHAQDTGSGAFVVTLGHDTIAVERFTRTSTTLTGDLVLRTPATRIVHYTATLGTHARVTRMDVAVRHVGQATTTQTMTLRWSGDTAVQTITASGKTRTVRTAAPAGTAPWLFPSYALIEQAVRQALAARQDSVTLPLIVLGGRGTFATTIVRLTHDSVRTTTASGDSRLAMSPTGDLLGLVSPTSTEKVLVTRLPTLDVEAMARAFARRDQAGHALGTLSPRDTVRATVGGASLLVDYSRPAMRGRTIFGGIVPWGQVWRTGANAATGFTTSRGLTINGVAVPAGSYTLWTLPSPNGWSLIINKQTGQWGTEYHADQDLTRIPMQLSSVPSPAERFTIAIDPRGSDAGVLQMTWDTTRVSVQIAESAR